MPANRKRVDHIFQGLMRKFTSLDAVLRRFQAKETPPPPPIPRTTSWRQEEVENRLKFLEDQQIKFTHLTRNDGFEKFEDLRGNIENFIGFSKIPTGVAGPLRINGLHANGDFFVPLATSEGALVASISRGCQVITQSGGAKTLVVMESVSRAPAFVFRSVVDACLFSQWASDQFEIFEKIVSETTRHGKLMDMNAAVIGNQTHLVFSYSTGDASGQNMVTISTDAICKFIAENSPQKPEYWFIEGNMSGDKKPTAISFLSARGKKVVAEIEIPRAIFEKALHTTPEAVFNYWKTSFVGGVQSGSIGVSGHYANALAAIYLACGQDVACVGESCVGITVCDVLPNGNFYISVTLPNLIVGTVGGGTGLPTQKECLEMLRCAGAEGSKTFAEICAASVLAGEISISAALAAHHFTRAHSIYGRKKERQKSATTASTTKGVQDHAHP